MRSWTKLKPEIRQWQDTRQSHSSDINTNCTWNTDSLARVFVTPAVYRYFHLFTINCFLSDRVGCAWPRHSLFLNTLLPIPVIRPQLRTSSWRGDKDSPQFYTESCKSVLGSQKRHLWWFNNNNNNQKSHHWHVKCKLPEQMQLSDSGIYCTYPLWEQHDGTSFTLTWINFLYFWIKKGQTTLFTFLFSPPPPFF